MSLHHAGKVAVVTGGTGALGSVIVRQMLHEHVSVAVPYHSGKSFPSQDSENAGDKDRTLFLQADLANEEQAGKFFDGVLKKFGTVDYLVNAAGGYLGGKKIADVSLDEWESIINLNLTTTFLMCRAALQVMRPKNSGRIVNIAAMTALAPAAAKGPYSVSKRGVITLTEVIAEETKGTGITANAIAPSIILTEANKEWMTKADAEKWVTPEEIATLVLYLCSDTARSISGNAIKMFGGV